MASHLSGQGEKRERGRGEIKKEKGRMVGWMGWVENKDRKGRGSKDITNCPLYCLEVKSVRKYHTISATQG